MTSTAHRGHLHSLSDDIAVLGVRDPEFAPGTKWSYGNYESLPLGRVLERINGGEYFAYIREANAMRFLIVWRKEGDGVWRIAREFLDADE